MTRVQKERFNDLEEYDRVKDQYILGMDKVGLMKQDAIIMHPLPRVNEIPREVDDDHRAKYFQQARNGLFIRMALLCLLLSE
jgi:aspartate carbamoyltransferase catalytic subunit